MFESGLKDWCSGREGAMERVLERDASTSRAVERSILVPNRGLETYPLFPENELHVDTVTGSRRRSLRSGKSSRARAAPTPPSPTPRSRSQRIYVEESTCGVGGAGFETGVLEAPRGDDRAVFWRAPSGPFDEYVGTLR